jgi:hypothetical protein
MFNISSLEALVCSTYVSFTTFWTCQFVYTGDFSLLWLLGVKISWIVLLVRYAIFIFARLNTGCPGYRYTNTDAYVLVPKSFMKFMFTTVYRVTQKDFYACPYTSMWALVIARQISKGY